MEHWSSFLRPRAIRFIHYFRSYGLSKYRGRKIFYLENNLSGANKTQNVAQWSNSRSIQSYLCFFSRAYVCVCMPSCRGWPIARSCNHAFTRILMYPLLSLRPHGTPFFSPPSTATHMRPRTVCDFLMDSPLPCGQAFPVCIFCTSRWCCCVVGSMPSDNLRSLSNQLVFKCKQFRLRFPLINTNYQQWTVNW